MAHTAWQDQVRRRARQRSIRLGATLAAAASLILAFLLFRESQPAIVETAALSGEPARVEVMLGAATMSTGRRSSAPRSVAVGASVPIGFELATSPEGRLALRLHSGHSFRLDHSTSVRLLDARTLRLDRGAVYVESRPGSVIRNGITVETPFGRVRDVGTQFEVRMDGDLFRLRVREGRAVVEGREFDLVAGTELEITADGSSTTRTIATYGAEWGWIATVAPMPDFAGRSAREFLDWVAREQGWTLRFSDPAAARSAEEIVLGSLGHLALEHALDAVLPTCLMAYRVNDGILWVTPEDRVD